MRHQRLFLFCGVSWDGPDSKDRAACSYPVDFQCKPAPAETLHSLESGRLLLQVDLGGGVRSVSARMINNAKRENPGKVEGTSELKHKTLISARLVQDRNQSGRWAGELSIPSSWIGGGTRTYDRRGKPKEREEPLHTRDNLRARELQQLHRVLWLRGCLPLGGPAKIDGVALPTLFIKALKHPGIET